MPDIIHLAQAHQLQHRLALGGRQRINIAETRRRILQLREQQIQFNARHRRGVFGKARQHQSADYRRFNQAPNQRQRQRGQQSPTQRKARIVAGQGGQTAHTA